MDARYAQGVIAGDHGRQENTFNVYLPAVEVSWPVRLGALPPPAAYLQPRAESKRLTGLADGQAAVLTQVLSGLGGVGKSQIAAEFARSAISQGVDVVVWATAGSREAIVSAYAALAAELGYRQAGEPEQAATWLLGWLSEDRGRRWLVVLDDLSDPADLRGLWPRGPAGQSVITTRRTDAALSAPGCHRIDVGLFSPDQACDYLRQRLSLDANDVAEAKQLAEDLGRLPLALAQAAAFMLDRGESCAGYRRRLRDRRRRLAEVFPVDALADEYRATVAVTWAISIAAADALEPAGLATPILELISTLDANGLPAEVATTMAARRYASRHRARTESGRSSSARDYGSVLDALDCRDALRHLARLSLVSIDPAGGPNAVRVHGLVQRATLDPLNASHRAEAARAAGEALLELWPDVERDAYRAAVLRANCEALLTHHRNALWQPDGHPVLWRAGHSLREAGLVEAALGHWQTMLIDAGRVLGPDHSDTLTTRHNLAYMRGEAGDAAGAATAYEQLLADLLRVLGPDHPETLTAQGNLASWRGEAGDAVGAATTFEHLLTSFARVLGPDHVHTLTTRSNVARWRGRSGDAAGAVAALEPLVTDSLRVLGPDHPDTLTNRNNLAAWRARSGDVAGAAEAFEHVLADRLRILGADHPHTLATRYNLASLRGEAGDAAGATAALEQVLLDQQRVLGPDHPDILTTRHKVAHWRGQAGDVVGAATAFENLLTDVRRVLGPDHRKTLTIGRMAELWRERVDRGLVG